ncbi:MAG: hypothetical protein GWM90_23480, partial [Gemmatimonadetes bacterium]|nr:hypothetical protein [Gemmatimonadota bacterium]NIQ57634.1 hypothetical protein [Gemmatimonadota bacterium]NIU77801.1 hypothetical protein [Gammaproteobacteria bacterium]NIX46933.1 hypothetical protein [Gemmatimonadota bacterium]NIY11282.1 hypothetical protein [Gemmatimonadota bacterium]
ALRRAMEQAGATAGAIQSVMGAGCRLDGAGAAGVSRELAAADARLGERVRDLAAALDRLDRDEYGRCRSCGAPIASERLDVLPATPRCRSCAA